MTTTKTPESGTSPPERCGWTLARLEGYWAYDLPRAEFRAVESHLQHCDNCAEAYATAQKDFLAALDHGMVQAADRALDGVLRKNADHYPEPGRDDDASLNEDRVAYGIAFGTLLHAHAAEAASGSTPGTPSRRALWAAAATLLFVAAIPAFAIVAVLIHQVLTTTPPGEVPTGNPAGIEGVLLTLPASTPGVPQTQRAASEHIEGDIQGLAEQLVDGLVEDAAEAQRLAALLPETDEEYEAWAREEYPQIMALYDALVDPDGDIAWNGVPVNIPEWGIRLYENTPEEERPTGWRALLVYSGEIMCLEFSEGSGHFSRETCPSVVRNICAVAGRSIDPARATLDGTKNIKAVKQMLNESNWTSSLSIELSQGMKSGSVSTRDILEVAADQGRALSLAEHIAISASCFGNCEIGTLVTRAKETVARLTNPQALPCTESLRLQLVSDLMEARSEALSKLPG